VPMPASASTTVNLLEALDAKPVDLWDAWVFAKTEAGLTLTDWIQAPDADKANAYTRYAAALDREEKAAQVLELGLAGQPAVANWG
jgi:hypothetical protein